MTRFSFLKRLANTGSLIFVICLPISASTLTGCSGATTTAGSDRACCRGLVLECAACEEGLTIDQWLSKTCPNGENNAFYGGWDASKKKTSGSVKTFRVRPQSFLILTNAGEYYDP